MKTIPPLLICIALVTSVQSYAASADKNNDNNRFSLYVEGAGKSAAEKDKIRDDVLKGLHERDNGKKDFKNLQGQFTTTAFCVSGYVQKLDYNFSLKTIKVGISAPVDCNYPGQCRGWQLEARPLDLTAKYDVTLKLHCSADDTLARRNQAARPNFQNQAAKK
jgi:hypothetical protein